MKMMCCPINGLRNITEFLYGGEVKPMPNPLSTSDREWAEYIFIQNNTNGIVKEWWMHVPTSTWFIAERDTSTDEVMKTYLASKIYDLRVEFDSKV